MICTVCACLHDYLRYQDMVNESTCGRVKRQYVPQPTAVSTSQVSQMRMTENLGVLWPIWLYEQKKGKKPEPKTIVRASRGNEKILGVNLDESVHGFPVEAIRLEHVHIDEDAIKKTTSQRLTGKVARSICTTRPKRRWWGRRWCAKRTRTKRRSTL